MEVTAIVVGESSRTDPYNDVDDVTSSSALDVISWKGKKPLLLVSSRTDFHDDVDDVVVVGARRSCNK